MNRLTIRLRLTALYGLLFLIGGALLLGVTYLLLAQRLEMNAIESALNAPSEPSFACRIFLNMIGSAHLLVARLRGRFRVCGRSHALLGEQMARQVECICYHRRDNRAGDHGCH